MAALSSYPCTPSRQLAIYFYQFEAFTWAQHSHLCGFLPSWGGPGRLVWCIQRGEVKKNDLKFWSQLWFSQKNTNLCNFLRQLFFGGWVGLELQNIIKFKLHKVYGCEDFSFQPRHWSAGVVLQGVEHHVKERKMIF